MLVKHALDNVRSCEMFSLVILFAIFLLQEFSAETIQNQIFFSGLCFPFSSLHLHFFQIVLFLVTCLLPHAFNKIYALNSNGI